MHVCKDMFEVWLRYWGSGETELFPMCKLGNICIFETMQPCKFSARTKESDYNDLVWKWRKSNSESLQLLYIVKI